MIVYFTRIVGNSNYVKVDKYFLRSEEVFFGTDSKKILAFVSLKEDGNRDFAFYRKNSADLHLTEDVN